MMLPGRLVMTGVFRKLVSLMGRPKLSRTCQISGLLDIYRAAGFLSRRGEFLEIGAYDGESFSNTSILADIGWRGVYIEPISRSARMCRVRHWLNSVSVVQAAVSSEPGVLSMQDMGPLTSADDGQVEEYGRHDWSRQAYAARVTEFVRCDTLAGLIGRSSGLDLVVVDVEGMEAEVVGQLIDGGSLPSMLIIELVDQHPDLSRGSVGLAHAALRARLLSVGYRCIFSDAVNTVFVDSELARRFDDS